MNPRPRFLTAVMLAGFHLIVPRPLGAQSATSDPSAKPPVPLEASVLLLSRGDYQESVSLMRRAVGYGCRRINVVVTLQCEVNEDDTLSSLGIGHVRRFGRRNYVPLTAEIIEELEGGLRACFAEAVARHVDLVILAHLDSNGRRDRWRNHFRFDPTQPIAGVSYEQAMLQMVLAALDVTRSTDTTVEFNLTGEMGSTIFGHADKYRDILQRMRAGGVTCDLDST